jgi:DNA primase large subunit
MKGIGMSLEDAMKFWRGEFTKRTDVDVDKFEKEYAYGIRYNYGNY